MTAERDTGRIVRSWLREDEHDSADRVLMTVLARLDTTPQRRPSWPPRRFPVMSNSVRIALAAAAVLVVALVGWRLLPTQTAGPGQTTIVPTAPPSAAPSPAPTTTPTSNQTASPTDPPGARVLQSGALLPGTYFTRPLGPPNAGMTFTFDVPDGWYGFAPYGGYPASGTEGPIGMGFGIGVVERLYSDPCKAESSPGVTATGDVVVGPSVGDLAAAFEAQTAYEASGLADVELGGFAGKRLDLQLPVELPCPAGLFRPWEGSIYAQGPGDRWHLSILDVEGVRVVVMARDFAATPANDRAELMGIVSSLQITP
jgi:hypothetical protein